MNLKAVLKSLTEDANHERPWRTAKFLAKKTNWPGSPATLENALLKEYQAQVEAGQVPDFRYSTLPSQRTLEVLWAPTAIVQHRRVNNITKDDAAHVLKKLDPHSPGHVFLSHSHRDFDDVMELASWLLNKDITPWLAETHIEQGGHINGEIILNLQKAEQFLVFLSSAALESKWTGKECGDALQRKKDFHVVLNLNDKIIQELALELQRGGVSPVIPQGPWKAVFGHIDQIPDANGTTGSVKFYAYPATAKIAGIVLNGKPIRPFRELKSLAGNSETEGATF